MRDYFNFPCKTLIPSDRKYEKTFFRVRVPKVSQKQKRAFFQGQGHYCTSPNSGRGVFPSIVETLY